MSGLSVPNWWLSCATASGDANGPRTRRATFPGSTFAMKKTSTLRSHSVISPSPMRLRMNLVMGGSRRGCRQAAEVNPALVMS
jgi:hypothetical protein